jgi:flavin-dependent dehydrogenase
MTHKEAPEVVIIGAGPAGSTMACVLARRGRRVMLVDRSSFPRAKVCGCCLAPTGRRVLRDLELDEVTRSGIPLRTAVIQSGGRRNRLDFDGSVVLSRAALDLGLIEAASVAGAVFQSRTRARVTPDDRVILENLDQPKADPTSIEPAAIVVADGLGGRSLEDRPEFTWKTRRRNRFGVGSVVEATDDAPPPGELLMIANRTGYLGVVRLEDGRVDLAAALHAGRTRRAGGPARACATLLEQADRPALATIARATRWQGTPALTRSRRTVAHGRVLCIGDASGYVEPFTGEGMSWGMLAAVRAASHVEAIIDGECAAEWTRTHHRLLRSRQRRCRAVSLAMRFPGLSLAGMTILGRLPGIGPRLAGLASGHPGPDSERTASENPEVIA